MGALCLAASPALCTSSQPPSCTRQQRAARWRQHAGRRRAAATAPAAATQQQQAAAASLVHVVFKQAGLAVDVAPGTNIYMAAAQAGADTITLGCCAGNCGMCEVEVRKFECGADSSGARGIPPPAVVLRSCVTGVPPGYQRIEVDELVDDIWGVDGYDT